MARRCAKAAAATAAVAGTGIRQQPVTGGIMYAMVMVVVMVVVLVMVMVMVMVVMVVMVMVMVIVAMMMMGMAFMSQRRRYSRAAHVVGHGSGRRARLAVSRHPCLS